MLYFLLLGPCQQLSAPSNGMNNCSSQDNYLPGVYCIVTCDDNYLLMGSGTRTCGNNDGIWSGMDATCVRISK